MGIKMDYSTGKTLTPPQWAGYRGHRRDRRTGALIVTVDAAAQGLDTAGGKWANVCDTHGAIINHETLARARGHARQPEWCEDCSAILYPEAKA